jgi:feruloyl esterase
VAQDHVDNIVFGYAYDGGWMTTVGIPARAIGRPSSAPGDEGQFDQFPYAFLTPPNPAFGAPFGALSFNFNDAADLAMLTAATPKIEFSTSLDIKQFVNYGHKIIWYHGLTDPGPPVLGTIEYYNQMAQQFGGLQAAQKFSRFYPVPNMDHCTGGATTDGFDFLTPLKNWVENNTPPGSVVASSLPNAFNATTYQVLGNYITAGFVNAPTTRSRPLCPYPQQARFTGSTSPTNGVPVATNPTDPANASNYTCTNGPELHPPLPRSALLGPPR